MMVEVRGIGQHEAVHAVRVNCHPSCWASRSKCGDNLRIQGPFTCRVVVVPPARLAVRPLHADIARGRPETKRVVQCHDILLHEGFVAELSHRLRGAGDCAAPWRDAEVALQRRERLRPPGQHEVHGPLRRAQAGQPRAPPAQAPVGPLAVAMATTLFSIGQRRQAGDGLGLRVGISLVQAQRDAVHGPQVRDAPDGAGEEARAARREVLAPQHLRAVHAVLPESDL
mmetsp:Transcript_32754/g.94068  ORF Transcript_32754/g.94068 Transcript_32754/m.94068 type:complete len:227 (-) Transcript_32754:508-1188(-)